MNGVFTWVPPDLETRACVDWGNDLRNGNGGTGERKTKTRSQSMDVI